LDIHLIDYFISSHRSGHPDHPITINGLGLREGSYIEIFKFYGSPPSAVSFSLVDVGFNSYWALSGDHLRRPQKAAVESA